MIIGTGIDLVAVSRIEKLILESSGFRERVFSAEEIAYCESIKNRFECYAARFAAKEAFAKATGLGIWGGIPMNEVQVRNKPNGAPELILSELASASLNSFDSVRIHLSLSHTKDNAIAIVTIEKCSI